jgi:putative redox protein
MADATEAAHDLPRVIARASARGAGPKWETTIRAGHHALLSDEGPALEGQDKGPAPFELLLAALGSCTAITLRMYALRKAWPLEAAEVRLAYREEAGAAVIDRVLSLEGPLDDAQRARLLDISERTPVTKVLRAGAEIRTTLA